ncbi:uncharacterized protein LOC110100805 [Dendrobium catenatum]|uniref:uncharacterized protein LOC110100805 n=1 Tax=Dendrobium catenatum TaxID=906689 RepID=UPI0010A02E57|nr:uncharacterized protein LOC110100805 [Dendrobium catenatum]
MASEILPFPTDNLHTIFVDSNVDTHLALVVSLYDTISEVKAKIAAEHALCFQGIGEISIQAIKVRRRGFFYNLTDSMYVLNAFDGVQGSWFVCIDIVSICTVKNQKILPNEVTNEQMKHHDNAVPVCSVDKHQEIVFCGLSPKNIDPDGQKSLNPIIDHGRRPTMLIDQEKGDRRKDDCKNLGTEASDAMPSATCTHKTIFSKTSKTSQQDKLLESQSQHYFVEKKSSKKLKGGLHEEHLEVCRRQNKFDRSEDIDESNKTTNASPKFNCDRKKEILANYSEGLPSKLPHENAISLQNTPLEKHTKKRKSKSSKSHEVACLAMPSETAVVVEKKSGKKLKDGLHEEHLEVCRRQNKFNRSEDIDESNKTTNASPKINCDGKKEVLADYSEGLPSKLPHENVISLQNTPLEKHTKKRKSKSSKSHEVACLVMPSETAVVRSPQVITDPQNSGKEGNASIFSEKCPIEPNIEKLLPNDEGDTSTTHDTASFLEVANQKETGHSMEVIKEPIEEQILQINPENRSQKHMNSSQYTNAFSSKEPAEAKVSSQEVSEFPIKSPYENTISLQNPQLEKHTKKRKRKSSKSHEEAPIVMPYGSVVVRSPQQRSDSHNSRKETSAHIFSGKYPPEPSIEESLANDEKDMSTSHDTASFLEVSNQKESRRYLKINEEPIEEHILQVNPEDQSKKHLNSVQGTNVDVNLEETAEARVSSPLASESTTKLYCSTDKYQSQSSKILEPKEANDQESREFYATKCITDLNLGEAGYVNANIGISASAEKFPSHEQATNAVSSLKGANKECVFAKVDYKGLSKSQRTTKKSKAELSRVCESAELNGRKDQFNSDNAQVSLNDAQNESNAAKFIKQADQKADGDHSIDAIIKILSSFKKIPNQEEVSDMNSGNPPICIPNNLSEACDAFVKQAAEISVPSQTSSEVQAKPSRSRKKSKCEPSKLRSQENSDVLLLKFNGLVPESNDERGSDPSKLSNKSNQKINLHCMDARVNAPLSVENSSKLVELPQVNPFESPSCKLQDFTEQSNAEIIFKGHVTQHEPLAAPTKSKCDRKKSKKESLKSQVSSEMSEPARFCRPDDSTIKPDDYLGPREGKHDPAVHAADPPSGKSESRKKNSTNEKTDIKQPNQDSPTNLVQPSSNKQHLAIGEPLENDINHETVDVVHGTGTKDSKTGIVRKAKNTKQSGKQNSSFGKIESDSSLHETHDKPKLDKKLHNFEPESNVQLSKSGAIGDKQRKKIVADGKGKTQSLVPDHDIDNMVSKDDVRYKFLNSSTTSNPLGDAVGSNNADVSQSDVMATEVASSESTQDTPYQKGRYRVVRKNPSSILSDASVTSSESENDTCKKKASIKTALDDLSVSVDPESHLEEVQTKASALKLPLVINFFGAESDERGEISKKTDGRTKNHSRSDDSARKTPLSFILKSSISYKKSKITASQSEFPESQPMGMVLETQPESAVP